MAKIWILSDLHYEVLAPDVIEHLATPDADVLVIAGDYCRAHLVIAGVRRQFPDIQLVLIAGNHEHYKNKKSVADDIATMQDQARQDRDEFGKVTYYLENDTAVINVAGEKLRFIGATLWTDFDLFNNWAGHSSYAQSAMNDYAYILGNDRSYMAMKASETRQWFRESRSYIERTLRQPFEGKSIVVTHHLPSLRSVALRYQCDPLTPAFASDCDDLLALGADLWVHGHTHNSADYNAGKTRVVCNPRGYPQHYGHLLKGENKRFNPGLVVEI